MSGQGKHWCLTIFKDEEIDEFIKWTGEDEVNFYNYQEEQCPDTGKTHLQAYIGFKSNKRFKAIKGRVATAHLELARNAVNAWEYCSKPETATGGKQGRGPKPVKSDGKGTSKWATFQEFAVDHEWEECLSTWPELRVNEAVMRRIYDDVHPREQLAEPRIYILFGPSGTGKSSTAITLFKGRKYYRHTGTQWFDGYAGQTAVLLDDFHPGQMTRSFLLNLMDSPNGFMGQVKGGWVKVSWDTLIITTQYPIKDWYKGHDEESDLAFAFYRRAEVWQYKSIGNPEKLGLGQVPGNTKAALVQNNIAFMLEKMKRKDELLVGDEALDKPELKRQNAMSEEQMKAAMEQ